MLLQEMYDARGVVVKQQSDLNDLSIKEGREFTAEEQEQYGKMDADYQRLTGAIERSIKATARADEEKRLALQNTPPPPAPPPDKGDDPEKREADRKKVYRDAFCQYVRTGVAPPELRASTDPQSVGTDADGGYTVPDEWLRELITALEETNVMRDLAQVIQTSSGTLNIPTNSAHGSAAWLAESAAFTVSKEDFDNVQLTPYKVGRIIKITQELLNDSMFNMESFIAQEMGRSIGDAQETAFVAGDGSSKPSGIAEATVGAATGVTAASQTLITGDELIALFHSIATPYRKNSTFLTLDATLLQIRKLKDGNGQYLWQPGLQAGQPDLLLGRPIVTSGDMPAATTGLNSVLVGDMRRAYRIADRVGFQLQRLNELYAGNGQVGFLGYARTDGKIVDGSAVRALTMA